MLETLTGIIDTFKCCIFTINVLTTLVPAFFLAAAVTTFVPMQVVLRYLGQKSNQVLAYLFSLLAGVALEICSCNVAPLYLSIYRRGAGFGPAISFLYGAPAINIVSMAFVFNVVGWRMGLWRIILTVVLAVLLGVIMELLYGCERAAEIESQLAAEKAAVASGGLLSLEEPTMNWGHWSILGLLTAALVIGATKLSFNLRLGAVIAVGLYSTVIVWRKLGWEQGKEWLWETWGVTKLIVPILLPAVILIGLAGEYIPIKPFTDLFGNNTVVSVGSASAFGSFMYFPILSEVAFVKQLLMLGMHPGPAMALLLTAPGLSLPTMLIIGRVMKFKHLVTYVALVIVLSAIMAWVFGHLVGPYSCPCSMHLYTK